MKYTGNALNEISFPLGGIGTGSIGLAGNGRLIDWEIFNRPDKQSINGYTHIAVRVRDGEKSYCRVLNGDLTKDLMGVYNKAGLSGFTGYGVTADRKSLYDDLEALRVLGIDVIGEKNGRKGMMA